MRTQTTTHLPTTSLPVIARRPSPFRRWLREQAWLLACFGGVILFLLGGALLGAWQRRPQSTPIMIIATPALPTPAPIAEAATDLHTSMTAARTLPCAVIAYSAPDRATEIRALGAGLAYTPTERLSTWVGAEVTGAGVVWMSVEELACVADVPAAAAPVQPEAPAAQAEVPVALPAAVEAADLPAIEMPAQPTAAPPPTQAPTPSYMALNIDPGTPTADEFRASFQPVAGANPFVGCLTDACREQHGQGVQP